MSVSSRQQRLTVRPRFACEPLESRRLLAAGDLDRSFSDDGLAEVDLGDGRTFDAADVAVQNDGKTVIVGSTSGGLYNDRSGDRIVVARLGVDGRPDPSFGPNGTGVVTTSIDDDAHGYAVAIQGDGKIVVVGTALETSGVNNYQHAIVRYEPWGALDPTFDGDGVMHFQLGDDIIDNGAYDVAIQGDGKIVVVGQYEIHETPPQLGDDEWSILRFNSDGSRDVGFGFIGLQHSDFGTPIEPVVTFDYNGTAATNPYYGSIVVAGTDGYDFGPESDAKAIVLRLEGEHGHFVDEFDGDGQASFRYPGRSVTRALGVITQPGGKIVLAGYTAGLVGDNDFLLVRYNPDGTLDRSFGGQGTGYVLTDFNGRNDKASSIISSYNGDRLLVGGSSNGNFALARYTNDGILDTAFRSGGRVTTAYASGPFPRLAAGPGRRFTAAGGPHFHAVRYLDEGANLVSIGTFDVNGGSEAGPENANFIVARTERLPTPLRVYLNYGGTAAAPVFFGTRDYTANGFSLSAFVGGSFVDIPANETFVSLSITPVDDALIEGDETATFTIAPDPSYDVGTPAGVTLEIHDSDATTVYAVADAHVRDGGAAGANFGVANVLETRQGGAGDNAEAYIKFDVSGISPDTSGVALKVFGRLAGGSAPVETAVFGVSASGWGEEAITWDNRPAPSTAALGTFAVGGAFESSFSVDVTDFVRREKAAGRDTVTLLLRNVAPSAAQTVWASRGSEYSDPRLLVANFDPLPSPVPQVSQVFAASTGWSPGFRQALEDHGLGDSVFGYAVPDEAAQLRPLPWGKIDQVSVRFTRNVSVVAENLAVRGVRVGSYAVTNFAYDAAQHVATWTLSPPIPARGGEKLLLDLDGDSPDGVSTFSGVQRFLDGEWANGSDTYVSGNGGPGGDLRFQINVLPGDVDGDGLVAAGDMLAFRNRLLRGAADPFSGAATAYSPLFDLDGDGVVGPRDQTSVRAALLTRLPAATPAAVAGRSNAALVRIAPRRTQFMQQ